MFAAAIKARRLLKFMHALRQLSPRWSMERIGQLETRRRNMANEVATKEEKKNGGNLVRQEATPLLSLQHEMNRLFDEFKHGFGFTQPGRFEPLSNYHAKVDVKDTEKEIVVTAELPGVDMKDIEVITNGNSISIKGEKRSEKEEKGKGYYKMERSYGSFYRLIPLPCEVEQENINASYKDGILKVVLAKSKESLKTEKKIEIKNG
jgi:HSP20 family protein